MELNIAVLRHECEERELDATGCKSKTGEDPENYLFKLLCPIDQLAMNFQKDKIVNSDRRRNEDRCDDCFTKGGN